MKNVHVRITNRVAYLENYNYDKLIPYWSFSVANYHHILRYNPQYRRCKVCHEFKSDHVDSDHDYIPVWDGKIKLLKRDSVPAGLFWATYPDIEKETKFRFEYSRDAEHPELTKHKYWLKSKHEYKFQNDCADEVTHAIKVGTGGLVLNATGSGKTRIAAMVASRFKCELLFIVDQLVLLRQAQSEISKHLGEDVGYVGESKFKPKRVTIATIQTLHLHRDDPKFRKWFQEIQIIIVDELHEALNRSNFDVVNIAKPLSVIGLTATLGLSKKPTRLKAYSLCGPIIYQYPVQRGMRENVLAKGICILLQYNNHLKNISGWNQREAYQFRVVERGERNYLISKLVRRAVKLGKYVIVVVDRLKHLEEISDRLSGVKRRIVAGTYKGKGIEVSKRLERKDKFEKGDIRCLIVNKVMKKGIDIKRVDVIINAAAKPSVNDSIQIFGRGIRKHKDKTGLICIDISDIDPENRSENWMHRAAKRRARALKQAGITTRKIQWNEDMSTKEIFHQAEKLLKKEINRK